MHPGAEVVGAAHGVDHVTPDGGVEGDGFERREMVEREGFETNAGAFEDWCLHRKESNGDACKWEQQRCRAYSVEKELAVEGEVEEGFG